jgi:hypothetical protein
MKRLFGISSLIVLAVALVPAVALAKGASEAEITGPGLDAPLTLPGEGRPGGERLMRIAEAAGFFAGVYGQTPSPLAADRPDTSLGARYTISYTMPGPNGETDRIVQHVYPYATPSPVTYMEPGQPFFGTERTVGGWLVATPALTESLIEAGLPETAPAQGGDGERYGWPLGIGIAALLAGVVVASAAVVHLRRRARTAVAS